MAQAGIHSMVGVAARKWAPKAEWLALGIVLGNLFPDADNLAVAAATLARKSTEGLHRTFTHSLFSVVAILAIFFIVSAITKRPRWNNLGLGLGIGVLMHILLDLLVWFNGVEILWPIPSWVNLWTNVTPPEWFDKLMLTAEFLFIALFFVMLDTLARKQKTDANYLPTLRVWTIIQAALFVVFTILVYIMTKGFMTIYGLLYLLSLGLAFGVTIRMRKTVEAVTE
ncbi:MAG: metal-dependent hydrolase [Chloroflexi bacterium]|nr:metal-dependent hydrolase [Chloroflexota bacterium]